MNRIQSFLAQTNNEIRTAHVAEILKEAEKKSGSKPKGEPGSRKRKLELDDNNKKIEVTEVIDMAKLELIHKHRRKLFADLEQGQKTLFNNYYNNSVKANGKRLVIYQQKFGSENYGRFSPKNGVSLQNIRKEVRNTVARDLYWQLDISNAHPWILMSLVKHLNWETPHLLHYVNNREKVLNEMEVPFSEAKRAILIIMYGGNASKLIGKPLSKFAVDFRAELVQIAKKIYYVNPALVKRLKVEVLNEFNEHKCTYSFLSRVLQDFEARCLVAAYEFMKLKGWQTGALLHDGLLILKRDDGSTIDEPLLKELTEYIEKNESLFNIKFQLKDMEEGYDFSKFEKSSQSTKTE